MIENMEKKFKIILNKFNWRIISEQSLEICIMIIFTVLVAAYANHEFEIPFFPRGASESDFIDITRAPTVVPETQTQTEAAAIGNVQDIISPEVFAAAAAEQGEQNGAEPGFASLNELAADGFTLTDTIYQSDEDYEYRFAQIRLHRSPPNTRNAVQPVMDYIKVRDGAQIVLLEASGRIIDRDFADSGLEILHKRDWQGRTIFRRQEITGEQTHYIFDPNSRAFQPLWFTDEMGDRGVDFMYPSYFGMSDNEWVIFRHINGLWGYQSTVDTGRTIAAEFNRAFNFSEGVGVAYRAVWGHQGRMIGRLLLGNRLYFFDEDGHVVNRDFFGPDPDDETGASLLGFYYFDHGLTRVISKQLDRNENAVLEQREHLINREWREFFTPEDYTIIAYSNGMILLEKDGRFGFMSHLGEWIVQPIFTYARPFFEGVAVIGTQRSDEGIQKMLIDRHGNILARGYDYISNMTGGIIAMFEEGAGWTVLNKVRRAVATDS